MSGVTPRALMAHDALQPSMQQYSGTCAPYNAPAPQHTQNPRPAMHQEYPPQHAQSWWSNHDGGQYGVYNGNSREMMYNTVHSAWTQQPDNTVQSAEMMYNTVQSAWTTPPGRDALR